MTIPTNALVQTTDHDKMRQVIQNRLFYGKEYWRPAHVRQDYWSMMYYLQDIIQQMKPPHYRRFISNEPMTAVDLAANILTRNEAYWRIALFEKTDENRDDRVLIGKIERVLQGIIYDVDEMFSMRLRMPFWKQVAFSALLRGWIWGKVHVTTDALKYRDTPILAEVYDPRLVYPNVDQMGLESVVIETVTNVGELATMYPDKFGYKESTADYDPYRPAIKVEYWSNDRGNQKGMSAVLAGEMPATTSNTYDINTATNTLYTPEFIIPPYYHGYSPAALPIVGVPVNGINLVVKPQLSPILSDRLSERQRVFDSPSAISWWKGRNNYVADLGRSILASVEEHVPQYNELIATVLQHLAISAYGTWTFTSPTGEFPNFTPGIESKIALTPEEKLDRIEIGAINADAFKLIQVLGEEKQNGTLANILRASQPFQGTGVLFQQMAQAAMNALEPFQSGMEEFGQRIGTSILAQMQDASGIIKPFQVAARQSAGSSKASSYWIVDFDPKKDLQKGRRLRPRPIFKPALPDDLAVRINAARLALDPRRPILSLTTVLEHILQVEDPTDEIDRIWEDIANTDPVIVFEQIAAALERMGETDLAQRIQEKQFRTAFTEELQFRQSTGGQIPGPGQMPQMPPEAGAGNTVANEDTQGPSGAAPGQAGLPNGDQTGV